MSGSRLVVAAAITLLGCTILLAGTRRGVAQAPVAPSAPALPMSTRGPLRIAFDARGERAYVTEWDQGALAILNAGKGKLIKRIPTGGEQPAGVAVLPDGKALVANSFSGSVALIDPASGQKRLLQLRGEPWGVAVSQDAKLAFVSLGQLNQVAVLDLPALTLRERIPVGRRPRALALTPDGTSVLAVNMQGGSVSVIATSDLKEKRRIEINGLNLRDISVASDGQRAFVTGQIPANSRATDEPLDMWTNTVFLVDLRTGAKHGSSEGWLDFADAPSPDPDGVVALEAERVAVVLSGSDEMLDVRTPGPHLTTFNPVIERRVPLGAHPRGMTLTPDRKHLWVTNELGSSISVIDVRSMKPVRKIDLGAPAEPHPLVGRYLFGSGKLAKGGQFSCNSCHPDGGADGLEWEFVHVPDGLVFRNSRNLRAVAETAPFRWSGFEKDLDGFIQDEIRGLLHGQVLDEANLHQLRAHVQQLKMPPNPNREEDGSHSPSAQRGKALFEGTAGCVTCHAGPRYGGTGLKAWIGTTKEGTELDVPHLLGVFDSAPYLHDSRAKSLEDIFQRHNGPERHGKAHTLTPEELADVLRYVREL
jgi:DNA-binding beta-propeller fold protein YncE